MSCLASGGSAADDELDALTASLGGDRFDLAFCFYSVIILLLYYSTMCLNANLEIDISGGMGGGGMAPSADQELDDLLADLG